MKTMTIALGILLALSLTTTDPNIANAGNAPVQTSECSDVNPCNTGTGGPTRTMPTYDELMKDRGELLEKNEELRARLNRYEQCGQMEGGDGWWAPIGRTGWLNLSNTSRSLQLCTMGAANVWFCYVMQDPNLVYDQDETCRHRVKPVGYMDARDGWSWEWVGTGVYGEKYVYIKIENDAHFYYAWRAENPSPPL